MSYRSIDTLQRTHAKMNRVAETQRIIEAIDDSETATKTISRRADIPTDKLTQGFLTELSDYGILEKTNQGGGRGNESTWAVANPSKIERLKADMMGATA